MIGKEALLARFAELAVKADAATEIAVESGAKQIQAAWVENIETEGLVLTGRYRDSITVGMSDELEGPHGTVSTDVPYAPILEYGDSRQAGHPVAQRALDDRSEAVIAAAGETLAKALL